MNDSQNLSDYARPSGTLPPQAKVVQAASPTILIALLVVLTFAGAIAHVITADFLEKFFGWVLIAIVSGSMPSGVSDVIRKMTGLERQ